MVPSYFEHLRSPTNSANRQSRKRQVDQYETGTSRGYAGKRTSTPAFIRANDRLPTRPIELGPNSIRRRNPGGMEPETVQMVFSAYYRPQIRTGIKRDETVSTPRAPNARLRKPVHGSVNLRGALAGSIVADVSHIRVLPKHFTYSVKLSDPQLVLPYRRMTREHPINSGRMRTGSDMADLIRSQWSCSARPVTH